MIIPTRFESAIVFVTCVAMCSTALSEAPRVSHAATPEAAGMVSIQSLVPDIRLDVRYAGKNNFVGERVRGYEAEKCYLLRPVAEALARVERALREQEPSPAAPLTTSPESGRGEAMQHDASPAASASREADASLRLKIFDCYRPVRAVMHFVEWAEDTDDQATKRRFYPNLDKSALLGNYISPTSGHSRGATVDLTLMRCDSECLELDMGTEFDFFDVRAHTDSPHITAEQRENRQRLREAMEAAGFQNYSMEWWHYTFRPEPSEDVAYDFLVK